MMTLTWRDLEIPTKKLVAEAICEGEMDEVWKAIRSELDADITVEYVGGPVQVRFGDFLVEGCFKRIPLTKIISEQIFFLNSEDDEHGENYHMEIADALIKQGNRLRRAVIRKRAKSKP